jgi:hypothetical protein
MRLFRRTQRVECPQATWTTLIWNFGTGMPATWTNTFLSPEQRPVSGTYIERRAFWIFPQAPVEGRLEQRMIFHRKWINAYYSLRVCPEIDLIAEIA